MIIKVYIKICTVYTWSYFNIIHMKYIIIIIIAIACGDIIYHTYIGTLYNNIILYDERTKLMFTQNVFII